MHCSILSFPFEDFESIASLGKHPLRPLLPSSPPGRDEAYDAHFS